MGIVVFIGEDIFRRTTHEAQRTKHNARRTSNALVRQKLTMTFDPGEHQQESIPVGEGSNLRETG